MKLEEIRKLIEAATPGPWKWEYWANGGGIPIGGFFIPGLTAPEHIRADKSRGAVEMIADDATFVAASRDLMPKLVAVAEAAKFIAEVRFEPSDDQERAGLAQIDSALAALEADGE